MTLRDEKEMSRYDTVFVHLEKKATYQCAIRSVFQELERHTNTTYCWEISSLISSPTSNPGSYGGAKGSTLAKGSDTGSSAPPLKCGVGNLGFFWSAGHSRISN